MGPRVEEKSWGSLEVSSFLGNNIFGFPLFQNDGDFPAPGVGI